MGRPKKHSALPSATEKIEEAFWKLLSRDGYEKISILRLTQETGLNRNTLYYHYDNVEDVAYKAVAHLMDSEVVGDFVSGLLSGETDLLESSQFAPRIKRLLLLAESNSLFLQSFVKDTLLQTWFRCFDIDTSKLTDADRLTLEFIASGITSVLGSSILMKNPEAIALFPTTELAKSALRALQNLPR